MALIYSDNTNVFTSIEDGSNDNFPDVLLGVKTVVSGNKAVLIKTTGFFSKLGASSNQKVVNCMDWKVLYSQFLSSSPTGEQGIQGPASTVQGATGALQYSTGSGLKNIVDTNSAKLAIQTILATQGIEYNFDTHKFNYPSGTIIVEPALHSRTGFFEI